MQRRKGKKGKRRRQPERWREKERAGYGGREGKRKKEEKLLILNLFLTKKLIIFVKIIF